MKKFFIIIVFWFLIPSLPVFANSGKVRVDHDVNITISAGGNANIHHDVTITNESKELVKEIKLSTPFKEITKSQVQIDGRKSSASFSEQGLSINFGSNVLRQNKSRKVSVDYTVTDAVVNQYGIKTFSFPKSKASNPNEILGINISYPDLLGAPNYISAPHNIFSGNRIEVTSRGGVLLMWGDKLELSLTELELFEASQPGKVLINLVPEIAGQETEYTTFNFTGDLGIDKFGNHWAIASNGDAIDFSARVTKIPNTAFADTFEFPKYKDDGFLIKKRQEWDRLGDKVDKAKYIYDSVLTNSEAYNPHDGKADMRFALNTAVLLQQANIPARVVYGYLWGVDYPGFDEDSPHMWVEADVNGEMVSLDPFLEKLTGFEMYDVTELNRLVMGVWSESNSSYDDALGLLSEYRRKRPEYSAIIGEPDIDSDIEMKILSSPEHANTASIYPVRVSINNTTPKIIGVSKILWDNNDIGDRYLQILPGIRKLLPPLSESIFEFYLLYPSIFYDGTLSHSIEIDLTGGAGQLVADYEILYTPGLTILVVIFVIFMALLLLNLAYKVRSKYQSFSSSVGR